MKGRHALYFFFTALFALSGGVWHSVSRAESPARVQVTLSKAGAAYEAFSAAFKAALAQTPITLEVGLSPAPDPAGAAIVVPVGVEACKATLSTPSNARVVCTLVPRLTVEPLITAAAERATAVYLDQPFRRQVALIQRALPATWRLGVVFGPASAPLEPALRAAARERGLDLRSARFTPGENMRWVLDDLLRQVDVLLAVPDPAVHTNVHIHMLLLAPYRRYIPVVGYSAAYVKSGAALGLFATPEQLAQQTAEVVQALLKQPTPVPPPQAPHYFTIHINKPVARSLGLSLPSAQHLRDELTKLLSE